MRTLLLAAMIALLLLGMFCQPPVQRYYTPAEHRCADWFEDHYTGSVDFDRADILYGCRQYLWKYGDDALDNGTPDVPRSAAADRI